MRMDGMDCFFGTDSSASPNPIPMWILENFFIFGSLAEGRLPMVKAEF